MSASFSFPSIAFVDLETTGATANSDRIIEVGIVEMDADGVREWSSLVNPETRIPEFIQSLTGITNDMVADAPTFEAVAEEVHARLQGKIFVAHNARFDHGFLKNAFKRTGHEFKPSVLCTVKLSRKLFPAFARHNLDAIAERMRLRITDRHRALGDARLLHQFWEKLHAAMPIETIRLAVEQLTARPALPSHLNEDLLDAMPTSHGVYLFYGENSLPLYVGKANNIRKRVMSHFSADHASDKELKLSQQVKRVEWRETSGELGALLIEAKLVKEMMPVHNHLLRKNDEICAWRFVRAKNGVLLNLARSDDLFFGRGEPLYGLYASPRKATDAMKALADEHQLCPALLGLEKRRNQAPCFASQVKRCLGACCGKETLAMHESRLLSALQKIALRPWPFEGPVAIEEGKSWHVVDHWAYLGTVDDINEAQSLAQSCQPPFDRDVYLILHKWLARMMPAIRELA